MYSQKTLPIIVLSLVVTSNMLGMRPDMKKLKSNNRSQSHLLPIEQNQPLHIQKTLIDLNNTLNSIQPSKDASFWRGRRSDWWTFNKGPALYTVELIKNECKNNPELKDIMENNPSFFLSAIKSIAAKFSLSDRHIAAFFSKPPQRGDFDPEQVANLEKVGVQFESNHWSSHANSLIIESAQQRLELQRQFDQCIQKEKNPSSFSIEEWDTFIQQGVDVNFSNCMGSEIKFNGYTPLHWVVYRHPLHITLITWLMEHGADTNSYEYNLGDNILDTFLWNAFNGYCRYESKPHEKRYSLTDEEVLAIIDLFQEHAQDKNITNICSNTNVAFLMDLLLDARKTGLLTQIKNKTPSIQEYSNTKKVDEQKSKTSQKNRSFSQKTYKLQTKFDDFIETSSKKNARFSIHEFNKFLQQNVDLNFTGGKPISDTNISLQSMYSPLHAAVSQNHLNLDVITALIRKGADVNLCYPDDYNPRYPLEQLIWYAFRYGSFTDGQLLATITLLLEAGADLNKIHPDSSIFIRLLLAKNNKKI